MMKFALYSALMLFPFLSFAKNFCETCGRDISPAKNASRCAGCSIRESVGLLIDCFRYPDKNPDQVKAVRRARRLGDAAEWNLICVNQWSKIKLVDRSGEHLLNYSMTLPVKDNPERIRFVLKDAADTYIIGGEKEKVVKHCGVYVLDNLPICLPGKNRMTLLVQRCSVDTIEYMVIADDGTGRSPRAVWGYAKSGEITDLSRFR